MNNSSLFADLTQAVSLLAWEDPADLLPEEKALYRSLLLVANAHRDAISKLAAEALEYTEAA